VAEGLVKNTIPSVHGRRGDGAERSAPPVVGWGMLITLLWSAVAGCVPASTELVVVVDTDFAVPGEVDRVEVTITGPSGRSSVTASNLGPGSSLPLSVGASPVEGAALSPVTITAVALLQGRTLVDRVIRTGFVAGERRLVPLMLVRSCAGVTCPAGQSCGPQGCAAVDVLGTQWPRYPGSVSRLDAGTRLDVGSVDAPSADAATDADAARDATPDGSADQDAGSPDVPALIDAPLAMDALAPVDTPPTDVAVAIDAVTVMDTPVGMDSAAPDTGPMRDVPPATDVGALIDTPPTVDTPPAVDVPELRDSPDVPVIPDVPVAVDVGPPVDAGCGATQLCASSLSCCGGDCIDLQRTVSQCGTCGHACPTPANATARCSAGRCDFSCRVGYGDCDGAASSGCETPLDTLADCGQCGRACALTNATSACTAGACAIVRCNAGFGDCDGDPTNGCEARLDTATNCGLCGRACTPGTNATSACESMACVSRCNVGYGDCDGVASNGCETNLRTSAASCGRCGAACAVGDTCGAGICANEAITQITAGESHACALRRSGTVTCWGFNESGLLGDGSMSPRSAPVQVVGITDAAEVDAGPHHTCLRRRNGQVWCWGFGEFGSLGDGTNTPIQPRPVQVSGLSDAESISVGDGLSCARSTSRGVLCWGVNTYGEIGDGTTVSRSTPVAVSMPGGATLLGRPSAGTFGHACAMQVGTTQIFCWGQNISGEIGDGTMINRHIPTMVIPVDASDVIAGGGSTCARDRGNGMRCWGDNNSGILGNGSTTTRFATPQTVLLGTSNLAQMAMGGGHACALRSTGAVSCWGSNNYGEIGDSTDVWRRTPVSVVGLGDAVEITAGSSFTCARRATGAVVCWGENNFGQLNDGTRTNRLRFVYTLGLP